jgi:DNA-binding IclR family transcriptional regulator
MKNSSSNGATGRRNVGPRSLARLLGLFDALARHPDGLKLVDLSNALQAPRSSLLNLLRPLVSDGYVSSDGMHYRLGPAVFRLSAGILSGWQSSEMLHPYVSELARCTRESVHLGVLDAEGRTIVYVDSIDSPRSVGYGVAIGSAQPLHSTAAGRVLLAFGDRRWVDSYLASSAPATLTPALCPMPSSFRDELAEIRRTRFSVDMGEAFPEFGSVAAPIFGLKGHVIAAIAVGAPVSQLKSRLHELRSLVRDIAERASGNAPQWSI